MATVMCDASPKVQLAYDKLLQVLQGKPPGMPLPSVPALKRKLGVSQLTVQRAYDVLERQGMIDRQRGRGVFVADPADSGEVAIIVKPSLLAIGASPLYAAACKELSRQIHTRSNRLTPSIRTGGDVIESHAYVATLDLLRPSVRDQLRGVFSFVDLYEVGEGLRQAGIPVVSLSRKASDYAVILDAEKGLEMAMSYMRSQGAGRIGLVSAPGPNRPRQDAGFTNTDYGFEVHSSWDIVDSKGSEFAGYQIGREIWERIDRPDALIVTDDILCNGLFRAFLHFGVELPENIRLITFANYGVPLHYHKPVTRVEFDWHDQCRQAVNLLMNIISGQQVSEYEPIKIAPTLIEGETG